MTEVLGNNGYNGYVAGNPPPQLQGCGNAETNNRDEFQLFKKASIRADQLTMDLAAERGRAHKKQQWLLKSNLN